MTSISVVDRGVWFVPARVVFNVTSLWSASVNVAVVSVVLMTSSSVTATVDAADVTASGVVKSVVTEKTVDIVSMAFCFRTVDTTKHTNKCNIKQDISLYTPPRSSFYNPCWLSV